MNGKLTILSVALFSLAGCYSSRPLDALNNAKPEGSPFSAALAKEYKDLGNSESDKYSWANSNHFAKKGMDAANGIEVEPENPLDYNKADVELQEQYIKLKDLREKKKAQSPESLARAQMLFDCWLEEEQKAGNQSHIAQCRNEYFHTMSKIDEPKISLIKSPYKKVIYKVKDKNEG